MSESSVLLALDGLENDDSCGMRRKPTAFKKIFVVNKEALTN